MAIYRKSGSSWESIKKIYRKSGSSWEQIKKVYRKAGTLWELVFSGTVGPTSQNVEVIQSTNSTTWLITLTGKYYHWNNADVINYEINRSIDGGSTWTTVDSGSGIVNPSSGSYQTIVYELDNDPTDVVANNTNIFQFKVIATESATGLTASLVADTTIYAPENITVTLVSKTYNSVNISWNASANAQKYLIYSKPNSAPSFTESHYVKVISGTSTTISGLSSNSTYDFMVIPITGVSNTYRGYLGNPAYLNDITTEQVTAPTQTVAPTKGAGNGKFGTLVYKGSPGTYTNALNVDTRLVYLNSATTPSNSTTTDLAIASVSSPHTVNQADFTHVSRRFYTQDDVTALDGTTHYYYYSQAITAYVDDMSDTFDRANAGGGLGTTSTGLQYDANRSNYVSTWAILSNKAYSSQSVSSNSISNPMQAIEAGGRYDIIGGLDYPNNGGGYGIAFWVTSANSWWAASTYYNQVTSGGTSLTCTGAGSSGSSCTNGSNVGDKCGCYISSTTYACNQTGGTNTTGCPTSGDGAGGVCNCSSSVINVPSTCSDNFSGASSCPAYGNNEGQRCSSGCTASTTYFCGSYVTNRTFCGQTGTVPYGPEDVGLRCGACEGVAGAYYYTVIQSSSTYSGTLWSASDSYTEYSWSTRTSTPTNTYSWNTIVETSTASTTYSSYVKVNKSDGSSVSEQGSLEVASSQSGYTNIPRLVLVTSGNSILVSAFNGATQIGNTLSVTGTAPSSSVSGSAAGIIKMRTPYNEAGYVDNLNILPS